jgi:hypothetical protein
MTPERAVQILRERHKETPSATVAEACLIGALAIEAMEAEKKRRACRHRGPCACDEPAMNAKRAYLAAAHQEWKHGT